MRVLLTNDDGVHAPGMATLVAAVRHLDWDFVVVAPQDQMSSMSRSRLDGPVDWAWTHQVNFDAVAVNASPASCVRLAVVSGLFGEFDLCISGINAGENLGAELLVSGTFGAASEAASHGLRGIALSRQYGAKLGSDPVGWSWTATPAEAARMLVWCLGLECPWMLANCNIANAGHLSSPALARVGERSYFQHEFDPESRSVLSSIAPIDPACNTQDDVHFFAKEHRHSVSLFADAGYTQLDTTYLNENCTSSKMESQ